MRIAYFVVGLLMFFLVGCSQNGSISSPAIPQPVRVTASTQERSVNFKSLVRVTLGVNTDKGWMPLPTGADQSEQRKALFRRSQPFTPQVLARGTGGHLFQVYNPPNSASTSRQLAGDAPPYFGLTPGNNQLYGGMLALNSGEGVPDQNPTVSEYYWTLPGDAAPAALNFGFLPASIADLASLSVTGHNTIKYTTTSFLDVAAGYYRSTATLDVGGQSMIVYSNTDGVDKVAHQPNLPQFFCTQSGLYHMRVVTNGVTVTDEDYIQKAPTLATLPLQDYPSTTSSPVHITNKIVWDYGTPASGPDDQAYWRVIVNPSAGAGGGGATPVVFTDTIDFTWDIANNQFLKAVEGVSKASGIPGKIFVQARQGLGKVEDLIYTYLIDASVAVQGIGVYPLQSSAHLPGRWRRVELVNPIWTPDVVAVNGTSRFTCTIVPLQFDQPMVDSWNLQITSADGAKSRNVLTTGDNTTIDFSWDGKDDSGAPFPVGNATVNLVATVKEAVPVLGQDWSVSQGFGGEVTLAGGNRNVSIHVADVPSVIDLTAVPPRTNLHLNALIAQSGFTNPSFSWTVNIEGVTNPNQPPVSLTSISGTGAQVSVDWDASQTTASSLIVSLVATVTDSSGSATAIDKETINVIHQKDLRVTEIQFDNAEVVHEENGIAIQHPRIYWREAGPNGPAISHSVLLNGDPSLAPDNGSTAALNKVVTEDYVHSVAFKLTRNMNEKAKYQLRLVNPNNELEILSLEPVTVDFQTGGKSQSVVIPTRLGNFVRTFPYLKLQSKRIATNPGEEFPYQDVDNKAPKETIFFTPFGTMKDPFLGPQFTPKDEPTEKFLRIAWSWASGATRPDEARRLIARNLGQWLVANNFLYDGDNPHVRYQYSPAGKFRFQIFDYKEFIKPLESPGVVPLNGDCHDVASLQVMACGVLGLQQELLPFLPGKLPKAIASDVPAMYTANIKLFAASVGNHNNSPTTWAPSIFRSYDFKEHETTIHDEHVWESLFEVLSPGQMILGFNHEAYYDRMLLENQSGFPRKPYLVTPHSWVTYGKFPKAPNTFRLREVD